MQPVVRLQAGLLLQFAFGRQQAILIHAVQLARRNLQQYLVDGRAELAHQVDISLAVNGQHRGRAHVHRDLPLGRLAVGQLVGHVIDVQDNAIKDPLTGEVFLHDGVIVLKNHASDLRFQLGSERLFDQLVRNSCHFPLAKRGNLLYNEIGTQ